VDQDALAEPLAWDIAFWAMAFDEPDYDLHALGDLALELGRKLRAIGTYGLLATGDPTHLFDNLVRSGEYRVRYLERAGSAVGVDLHHAVLGRLDPILDLVAADRDDLVRRLVALSPPDHDPQREYLDDFCYARALASLFLDRESPNSQSASTNSAHDEALDRYDSWLDGDPDVRLDVCRALASADVQSFVDAFETLLGQHVDVMEMRRETELVDALIPAGRSLFVEGLALLNIARHRGLVVRDTFALCPDIARIGHRGGR